MASELQRKIFTRWCNQKLRNPDGSAKAVITDCVSGVAYGHPLIHLIENLSESEFGSWKKIKMGDKISRIQQMENCNAALKFCWQSGVQMKMKPSAEDMVDGKETQVMGLIWAIMMKFMVIEDDDDDDEGPPAKFEDALKMWVNNQISQFGLKVSSKTKSYHDGRVFCALVAGPRPKIINYETDVCDDAQKNIKKAFEGAETYFGLEQYLEWTDIAKLDSKSMVVYVSEFYYGISAQRKVDLAARRITKLCNFTKQNDAAKASYTDNSAQLRAHFDKVFAILDDTAIDNTMAGAIARLAQFNDYRKNDKAPINKSAFECESTYQALARRLHSHQRPEFKPAAGCSVPEITASLEDMEKKEAERNVALHDELNRQIKLDKIYKGYQKKFEDLQGWVADKKAYLSEATNILSVGEAKFALNTLDAYDAEFATVAADTVPAQQKAAAELLENKFEFSDAVTASEAEIKAGTDALIALAATKKAKHEDDLKREEYKVLVRGWNSDHIGSYTKLEAFIKEKQAYLETKEDVTSIADAELHLSLLAAYCKEKAMTTPNIAPLNEVGKKILEAKYESDLSNWVFEEPDKVQAREKFVADGWEKLTTLSDHKKAVLDDHLARELYREEIRKKNEAHKSKHADLKDWIAKSEAYLAVKEPVDSVPEAQDNLAVMLTYCANQAQQKSGNVVALQALGQEILTASYKTEYSSYKFETPEEVKAREEFVSSSFVTLEASSVKKTAVLEDDLAREQYRFKVHLWNQQHKASHAKLEVWITDSKAYLQVKEAVDSIADAELNLKTLANYDNDKVDVTKINKAVLDQLTKDIHSAEYKTDLSSWKFETPDEVTERQDFVDKAWKELDALRDAKKAVLDEDMKREIRKEELRVAYAKQASDLTRYAKETVASCGSTMFGFVLEEVEAFEAVLATQDADITKHAAESKTGYTTVYTEMVDLGVRPAENPYTKLTPEDLEASQTALATAVSERKTRFDAELARVREDDKLCKELAAVADPFVAAMTAGIAAVNKVKADIDAAHAKCTALIEEAKSHAETPGKLSEMQKVIDGRKILYNRYTLVNDAAAAGQWEQYNVFLPAKQAVFAAEIEHKKLRGVTPEQYAEIEKQFEAFDKDKSGFLDRKEFKACLYSMGEERGKKEVKALMVEYGEDQGGKPKISRDGYKEFMISQLGDTDTEDEIVVGFGLINRGDEKVDEKLMLLVLEPAEVDYIKSTHPEDYKAWSQSVFAR